MNCLYLTGGRQRSRIFKRIREEWNYYEKALILGVDPENATAELCVDYASPRDVCADSEMPSVLFKAGTLKDQTLYICTSTEILIYQLPEFQQIGYISLPCFNDLHHVCPTQGGNLLVVTTGLDMVVEITPKGEVLREWNVLGEDPWARFSRSVDYRKIATTKPHKSHPNHVFELGSEIWVTRATQRDCISLNDPHHQIKIGGEAVHDGQLHGNKIYFTQVDGHLIIVDQNNWQIVELVNLNSIDNVERKLLGWCRGLYVVDEQRIWVGFTRVRDTKFRENVHWVKQGLRETAKPAHIALYDIGARKLLKEIDLEAYGMNVVFSILPALGPRPAPVPANTASG